MPMTPPARIAHLTLTLVFLVAAGCAADKASDSETGASEVVGPWLRTAALTFDVGVVGVNDEISLAIYLTNQGDSPVHVTGLALDDPAGAWSVNEGWATGTTTDSSGAEVPSLEVPPGGDTPVYVPLDLLFTPTDEGLYRAMLTVTSDDPGAIVDAGGEATWTVTLRGQALWPCGRLVPWCVDLGEASAGLHTLVLTTLSNCGAVPLTWSDASVTGEAELVNTLPTTLLPEADTAVQLGWSLEGGGPESAALTLITDAPELDDAVVVYANSGDDACGVDRDGDGLSAEQGDCDDEDALTSPWEDELYDTIDNDCDGLIDEGTYSFDDDNDGYAEVDASAGGDCDDEDPWVWPGSTEDCDGADNDCDGLIDEGDDGEAGSACAALE